MMSHSNQPSLIEEIADFLLSQPTLSDVLTYQTPARLDKRMHELLDQNARSPLSDDEREELDKILTVTHLMIILKAKAELKLNGEL